MCQFRAQWFKAHLMNSYLEILKSLALYNKTQKLVVHNSFCGISSRVHGGSPTKSHTQRPQAHSSKTGTATKIETLKLPTPGSEERPSGAHKESTTTVTTVDSECASGTRAGRQQSDKSTT
ncbi:hypothetical protein TKK_0017661 [Trichogramma kaykai]